MKFKQKKVKIKKKINHGLSGDQPWVEPHMVARVENPAGTAYKTGTHFFPVRPSA